MECEFSSLCQGMEQPPANRSGISSSSPVDRSRRNLRSDHPEYSSTDDSDCRRCCRCSRLQVRNSDHSAHSCRFAFHRTACAAEHPCRTCSLTWACTCCRSESTGHRFPTSSESTHWLARATYRTARLPAQNQLRLARECRMPPCCCRCSLVWDHLRLWWRDRNIRVRRTARKARVGAVVRGKLAWRLSLLRRDFFAILWLC